ncbi:hypothetical protein ANCDUO_14130 [Ancylostoma duodenale]|uniref:Uncharacterized protein n=1 Tax=Ancylostoma duodenale TaxID=51022 RepID=A0A0C2D0Z4_9BILA|nr:hypothetical protein ANCDUO_14130 [Ancylostoma duodenale]
MAQKRVIISMHEKTSVSGVLVAMKGDGSHFIVDQLKTPIGVMDSAVLRCVFKTSVMDAYLSVARCRAFMAFRTE